MQFNKKEIRDYLFIVLFLGFAFGFDDGQTVFNANHWLSNLFKCIFFVGISLGIYILVQKKVAKRHGAYTEFGIWTLSRFKFQEDYEEKLKRKKWPIGIIISIILLLVTMGRFFFTALFTNEIKTKAHKRVGWKKGVIQEWEEATIYLAGPLSLVFLIVVLNSFGRLFDINTSVWVVINLWILGFNILPIPGIDGFNLFIKNRQMYVFGLALIIVSVLLSFIFGIILSLILSMIMALIIVFVYFMNWEI